MNINITIDDITSKLLQEFISKDQTSKEKEFMVEADKYYNVKNTAITNRRKMMMLYDEKENPYLKDDFSKANNKTKHSYLQELINQCTNYLAGKPMKIDYKKAFDKMGGITEVDKKTTNPVTGQVITSKETKTSPKVDKDKEAIDTVLFKDNNFVSFIQDNIKNVQLYGKTYFRIVKSADKFKLVIYNPKEIIMFYNDFDEPILCIRYFSKPEIIKDKNGKSSIVKVDYAEVFNTVAKDTWKMGKKGWEKTGIREAVYANKMTYGEVEKGTVTIKVEPLTSTVFPIIEWKFNDECIPTLVNIKDFIDLQDTNLSDLANNVEDIQEAIWILENYNGQNIKEFMNDLKVKKAVKVGTGGKATPETIDIPVEARVKLYELCNKNIYKFGFGINFSDRDSLGNVTGVALKWSYAPLEQKANSIENNGQNALNHFFNILFMLMGLPYDSNDLEFNFDRTMISNEQEQTATVMSASSQLSQKTILDNLPMVKDTEDEIERLEGENEYEPTIPEKSVETGKVNETKDDNGNTNVVGSPNSRVIGK